MGLATVVVVAGVVALVTSGGNLIEVVLDWFSKILQMEQLHEK